ncbi:MAG: LacI family DNA-binding transcriptional regulator [Actinomycetota bacterium]|nr:LacI family DNA-binding transcriptional regulator [Actinomycetota bacterium]
MAATIHDVARHAGVSSRTVTNVLNDYKWVSDETRRRVRRSIDELEFVPNPVARNLRLGRTGLLALAVPNLMASYFAELSEALVDAATLRGFGVVIELTKADPAEELRLLATRARSRLFDGLIFSPLGLGPRELHEVKCMLPVVMLGERVHGDFDHVGVDNVQAAADAVEHLIAMGRRRIAVIGRDNGTGIYRTEGYRRALEHAGIVYDESLVAPTSNYFLDDGSAAMAHLLDQGVMPDAVFCCNDTLAIGALRTLFEHGLHVPNDVAVVGFDDVDDGRYAIPSLTTIAPDKAGLAAMAVDRLVRRMDGDTSPAADLVIPHRLVVRESTAGLAAERATPRAHQRRPRPAASTTRQATSGVASKRPSRSGARRDGTGTS